MSYSVADPARVLLTAREAEVVAYMANGLTHGEIAQRIYLSPHTIKVYVQHLQDKFQARNGPHIVALALKYGVLGLDDVAAIEAEALVSG